MVEQVENPIRERLPLSISYQEYRHAYARLYFFAARPFDKNNLTLKKLSVYTSAVGEDLSLALRGGGVISKEYITFKNAEGNYENYENWRWTAAGYIGKGNISAVLIPEDNQIYIFKSYTGGYGYGFILKVPIKTTEYSILTADWECPSLAFFQDHKIIRPSNKNTKDANLIYAKLLTEAVRNVLKILPTPEED